MRFYEAVDPLPDNDVRVDTALYVRELQEYLRALSYRYGALPLLGVDGIYGPETAQAVQIFQRWFRLEETGAVDRLTWELIVATCRALEEEQPPILRATP